MNKFSDRIRKGMVLLLMAVFCHVGFGQTQKAGATRTLPCADNKAPYRDFDFIVGRWDYRAVDGTKLGEQIISKEGEGCAILEEWTEVTGITGRGLSFVDPKTGLWRQVWMSSRFHIDYSGGLDNSGAMVLEGTMYPTNGNPSVPIKGSWIKQDNGSIKKEFQRFDDKTNQWETFFTGFAHPKKD